MATRDSLLAMSWSVWEGRIVAAAAAAGLFDALTAQPRSAERIAADAGADPRAAELVLNALAAIRLVRKTTKGYAPAPAARRFLRTDTSKSIAWSLRHQDGLASSWARLSDVIRTGRPIQLSPAEQRRRTEVFIRAMHDLAMERAPALARHFATPPLERMLDVGGGSGIYSVHFCRLHRRLAATIFDRKDVLAVTARILQNYREQKRIRLWPGDLDTHSLPKGFDLILLSHVIHSSDQAAIRGWLAKLRGSLRPAGQLVIQDFFTNPLRTAPPRAAIFAINMLLRTPAGRTYSTKEVRAWLREAGFARISKLGAAAGGASVLVARAPR